MSNPIAFGMNVIMAAICCYGACYCEELSFVFGVGAGGSAMLATVIFFE